MKSNHTRCPACGSYGYTLIHRRLWRKALRLPNDRRCLDCGHVFKERHVDQDVA